MNISIIVAASLNRVIGQHNKLPWHMPADLRHFKTKTVGHPILMGSHTFRSIGRVLPNRTSIVVSSTMDQSVIDYKVVRSIEEGIAIAKASGALELFVIGGGRIYEQTLPIAHTIYLTQIHAELEGDIFFPVLGEEWKIITRSFCKADEQHPYDYEFTVLKKEATL
ncbi:MAG: dihydrofolate reductase [Amoebophilaceae bacterium]|nr:dihydrofolate reductase [Amoebophilaceae bacterium]